MITNEEDHSGKMDDEKSKETKHEKGNNEKGELAREAKTAEEKKKSLMEEVLEILYGTEDDESPSESGNNLI